jgi:phage/plasmid-associated DNA primase
MAALRQQLKDITTLNQLGLTYFSATISCKKEGEGEWKRKDNGLLWKEIHPSKSFADKLVATYYDKKQNAILLPLGPYYNLIGIDVDNKNGSVEKFLEILKVNQIDDTFTMSTMNGGFHYYFTLDFNQRRVLELHDFKMKNDAMFNCNIDVKYKNQVFTGPTVIEADKTYQYKIHKNIKPVPLPYLLFDELIYNLNKSKPVIVPTIIEKVEIKSSTALNTAAENSPEENGVESTEDKRLKLYLNCLELKRWESYESWFKLGAIICNEKGSLSLFKEYSSKAKNYDEETCDKKWKEYLKNSNNKLSIASLFIMAKNDNPKLFENAKSSDKEQIIHQIVYNGITDRTAALLFYYLCPDRYIYDQVQKKWYVLNEYNIWLLDKDNCDMCEDISNTLPNIIKDYYNFVIKKTTDKDTKEILGKLNNKNRNYLESSRSLPHIIIKCRDFYKKRNIYEKMDNVNNYLFAFDNGVYDLKKMAFRLPTPEELITVTCGYDYVEPNDEIKKAMKHIDEIVDSMFSTKNMKIYMFTVHAQCLAGEGHMEKIYIFIGCGGNGKGLLRDLIMQTFGQYYQSLDIDYLTRSKMGVSATGPDEVLASMKNARIVVTTEPESDIELRTNKLKQWSGKDPITCRACYGSVFTYIPKFSPIIQTNVTLTYKSNNAMTRRMEASKFPYFFTKNAHGPDQKETIADLKDTIKDNNYKIALFHILLDYYKKFVDSGRQIELPEEVVEQTAEFKAENDPVTPFYQEIVITKEDGIIIPQEQYIKSSELYGAFKKYHGGNSKGFNIKDFRSALEDHGIKPNILHGISVYRGIKLNTLKLNGLDVGEMED